MAEDLTACARPEEDWAAKLMRVTGRSERRLAQEGHGKRPSRIVLRGFGAAGPTGVNHIL